MSSSYNSALQRWREALGEEGVVDSAAALDDAMQNTTAFRPRQVVALLRPRSAEEVTRLVRVARSCRVPVYPISTGRNWGLGSKLPTADGCAIVELRGLNRIREVDESRHCAIIEAGVSQRQLSEYLLERGHTLMLNVTGSSPDSSLVGNVLERGTGFTRQRTEDLRGIEVVLGSGELIRTGFWADESPDRPARHYKHGIGASLDGLFTQSNFGIVTAIQLDLVRRSEAQRMYLFSYDQANLPGVVDTIADLYDDGALRWITHMFNDRRMKSINAGRVDTPKWTGVVSAGGGARYVRFVTEELTARLRPLCTTLNEIAPQDVADPDTDAVVRGLFALHTGRPTTTFMSGLYNTIDVPTPATSLDDVDRSRVGMLTCLPLYPMDGRQVLEGLAIVDEVCAAHSIVPAVTLNPIDADGLESVTNIYFDRADPEQTKRAHACNERLHTALLERGFRVYRVDVENMRQVVRKDSVYWQTLRQLKLALDPGNIIAPGRYNLV